MRGFRLLLWPAGVAVGVAAESVLYGWSDPRWIPDLAAGWSLIACGLVGWSRRPESRSGGLLVAAGFFWFAGNFAVSGVVVLAYLSRHALYLHRGPLVQGALTYPTGRARGRVERAAVVVGYGAAIVTTIWRSEEATIALALLLALVAVRRYRVTPGLALRDRLIAVQAAIGLAAVLAGTAIARLAVSTAASDKTTLLVYELALCAFAALILSGLVRGASKPETVTDLVVELGEARSGTLQDALAGAFGDPTLKIGFWLPESGGYVDAAGASLGLPEPGSDRRATVIERDGRAVAMLVHDPAVLDDPALVEAVGAATRLAAVNARLQAEVRVQVAEVQASRGRLIRAGDGERRRLEQRLREGAERRLSGLTEELDRAHDIAGASPETMGQIERGESQLARTLSELRELAAGLHPRALGEDGLLGALAALAERSTFPVNLTVPSRRLPSEVEAATYFVCSEALANVAKYASATHVSLVVTAPEGGVRVEVADDGIGGADPMRGSGLRGLADRVEALGGTFRVESPTGQGTRLTADFPVNGETS